jgi:hypothetical protein
MKVQRVLRYVGNFIHEFKANINSSQHDFTRKATAFSKYAAYDDNMVGFIVVSCMTCL